VEAYLVTDRRLAADDFLKRLIRTAAEAGVDRIQIREKDLGGRALWHLTRDALAAMEGSKATLLVNDRLDVALAASAHGVHLGRQSMPLPLARRVGGEDLILGASAHSMDEATEAQDSGADYLFVGPVFPTPSKAGYGDPLGIAKLESILRRVKIPAYAIGGITSQRLPLLRALPLTGVAMISEFVRAPSIAELVRQVHGRRWDSA
jgi:thiamine-phosphate pyrophosphorylase